MCAERAFDDGAMRRVIDFLTHASASVLRMTGHKKLSFFFPFQVANFLLLLQKKENVSLEWFFSSMKSKRGRGGRKRG